jgi:hypothetical protein
VSWVPGGLCLCVDVGPTQKRAMTWIGRSGTNTEAGYDVRYSLFWFNYRLWSSHKFAPICLP